MKGSLVRIVAVCAGAGFLGTVAMGQEQVWVRHIGTSATDRVSAASAAQERGAKSSDVVVAGWTSGELGGVVSGAKDYFIARYDSVGNQMWVRQFGTEEREAATTLASDDVGGVMVGGQIEGRLIGGGSTSDSDGFLARHDADGNQLWFRVIGAIRNDSVAAIVRDGTGGTFVAGSTMSGIAIRNVGGWDAFLLRYDADGNRVWARQLGSTGNEYASALVDDGQGGVIIAGTSDGDLAGPNVIGFDVFISKYDSEGNQIWLRVLDIPDATNVVGMARDGNGGFLVAGKIRYGGPEKQGEVYIARCDSEGNILWERRFSSIEGEQPLGASTDGEGGILVTGQTFGSLGGPLAGRSDVFVAYFDGLGRQLWIEQLGSSEGESAYAIALLGEGAVVVAGNTTGAFGGAFMGQVDGFVGRYEFSGCYADCDISTGVGVLDLADFLCFQISFVASGNYACNCDTSTGENVCDIFDFLCFQSAFVGGCP